MDQFDKQEFKKLMQPPEGSCVSIYIPTFRKGFDVQQNQIRFKNALSQAQRMLKKAEVENASEISHMLEPAEKLLSDQNYWMNQDQGLAVFLSRETADFYRTPLTFKPLVIVSDRFHVKPVIPLLDDHKSFYLLTVTLNSAQLFSCKPYLIRPLNIKEMPDGLSDILKYDIENNEVQYHTGTGARGAGEGKRAALYHGQGAAEMNSDDVLRYFRSIENAIQPVLNKTDRPLLFAGLDHFFPLYKQVNSYPHLLTDLALKKNPESLDKQQLQKEANQIMANYFNRDFEQMIDKYHSYKGTGKTGDDLEQIINKATTGGVDTLIVGIGIHQWGNVSENEIEVHDRKDALDKDLLDVAAFQTILNGGKVYAVPPDNVPGNRQAVALYRY